MTHRFNLLTQNQIRLYVLAIVLLTIPTFFCFFYLFNLRQEFGQLLMGGLALFFLLPPGILLATALSRIDIDEQGLRVYGQLRFSIPQKTAWADIATVRETQTWVYGFKFSHLFFKLKNGQEFLLPEWVDSREQDVHSPRQLTLRQAVEQHCGTICAISEHERSQSEALKSLNDMGKEVGHIAYAAVLVMVIGVALIFVPVIALENNTEAMFAWGSGILAFIIGAWYLRASRNKLNAIIPLALLGACSAFVGFGLSTALPYGLGNMQKKVFTLAVEGDVQIWRSDDHDNTPQLVISAEPQYRRYHDVGTQQELNIYQALGLAAVPRDEYRALLLQHQEKHNKK